MNKSSPIRWIENRDIDKTRWDKCIADAPNELVYAYSFYLDVMSIQWDALVLGDYETVMPLPRKKKYGIHYLYRPFLTPVLGVFGKNISETLVSDFLEAIPGNFKLWDLNLNHFNPVHQKFQRQIRRSNYILPLSGHSYQTLADAYSENIKRNISKAIKAGCILKKDIPFTEVLAVCKHEWPKFTNPGKGSFDRLSANFTRFSPYARSYGVYHPDGKLLASCVFLICGKRAYYWLVGNDPQAKKFGASAMLIDQFIKDHAGKDLVLDFEGSDNAGIAEFYRRFGASLETYTTLYTNNLPFPISLLKQLPPDYARLLIS